MHATHTLISAVIPGRDMTTLEKLGYYYLLFKSPISAFIYQGQATRISKLVKMYTPSSLASQMPPPPGYLSEGEDIHELMQSYALTPPRQNISIRQLAPPLTPVIEHIVRSQGYPHIVNRPERAPAEVLMRLDGPQMTVFTMKDSFNKAERARGVPWVGGEYGNLKITKWEPIIEHISPLSPDKLPKKAGWDEWAEGDVAVTGARNGPDSERPTSDEEIKEEARLRDRVQRKDVPRYILGFANDAEASIFVRFWHRRPFGEHLNHEHGELAATIHAEILW